jgi:hypothetical protein
MTRKRMTLFINRGRISQCDIALCSCNAREAGDCGDVELSGIALGLGRTVAFSGLTIRASQWILEQRSQWVSRVAG